MKRKVIRGLAFSVPVLILVILLFRERSPFGARNSSFAIDPQMDITRIEFSLETGELTLSREGETWLVNKKYETRKSSILFILKILSELQIKSPVTPELFNDEIVNKGILPVKVKVFQGRKLLRSFLVYRTGSNVYGNIMKLKENSRPFIVYVPGNEVEIGSAFNINELFWQPFTVFELLPSEISSVTIENVKDPESSFMIRRVDKKFILSGLKSDLAGWDSSRVNRYISYFTHIQFESWALDLSSSEKESIKSMQPLFRFDVVKTDGESTILNLWERHTGEKGDSKPDSDRLWGNTGSGNEIFVIRYLDIDPLLKKKTYFFTE